MIATDAVNALSETERPSEIPPARSPEAAEPQVQIVVVSLHGVLYGINILAVREVLKAPNITWVPWTPEFMIGVINVRGEMQAIVDLHYFLHHEFSRSDIRSRIILVEQRELMAGFLVDEMLDIISVPARSFSPQIEAEGTPAQRYVDGYISWRDRLIALLNTELLMQDVVVNQG